MATTTTTTAKASGVCVIQFSDVPASSSVLHPLGAALRQHIYTQLQGALSDATIGSIILTGGGGSGGHFSAGADLTEFASLASFVVLSQQQDEQHAPLTLVDVVNAIEASPKPVVAAIQGNALGGGLEVALACHARIGTASAKLGLPEVQVGVIPGAGGTQRLPRLVGLPAACQMILTGQAVPAPQALKMGLIDAVVPDDHQASLLEKAKQWAAWLQHMPLPRTSELGLKESPAVAHAMLHTASLSLPATGTDGYMAAIEALRAAYTSPSFPAGLQREGQLFVETLLSPQGQARRHVFFAIRAVQKPIAGLDATTITTSWKQHPVLLPQQAETPIGKTSTGLWPTPVAVIGAGTMGSGIALVLLQAGYMVYLVDVDATSLQRGLQFVQSTLQSYVKRGKRSADQVAYLLQHCLRGTQQLTDLSACQLVVEAVVEKMRVKQAIFRQVDQILPDTAILLSNTSTLDMDAMASVFTTSRRRRAQFAGWHFFSPAHVMKLVEIVVGRETAVETIALLQVLTKRIGKTGVVVGNCDGFCGNRLLKPYAAESVLLLTEGNNTIEQVDQAFLKFGMMLGPLQMSDLAGNDVGYYVRKERGWVRDPSSSNIAPPTLQRPDRYTELADVMVSELGRLGQKVGKGWYDYDPAIGKGRKGLPSREMERLIESFRTAPKNMPPTSPDKMIQQVFFPLVNEGFKCLEEAIVRSPSDIDVVYILGYGWPVWRGGPMYWADHDVTLPVLLETLQELHRQYPTTEHYRPSKLLEQCVALGVTVEDYYKQGMQDKNHGQLSRL